MESLQKILAQHPFLKDLEQKYLQLMVGCASNVRFDVGTFIYREREDANHFYILRTGKVALEIHDGGRETITIETLGEGDVLGWAWLVPPYRWHADAHVLEMTHAIALDGKCLRDKCGDDHHLGYELMMRIVPLITHQLQATQLQLMDVYGVRK